MISINYDDESILTLFGIHERLQKIRDYNIQLDDVEYSKIINYLLDYTISDRNELDSVIIHWCLHLILQTKPKRFLQYWRLEVVDKWTRQLQNNNYAIFEIIKTFEMMILSAKEWIIHGGKPSSSLPSLDTLACHESNDICISNNNNNDNNNNANSNKTVKRPINMAFTSIGTNIDNCINRITKFIINHLTDHLSWYLNYLEALIHECKGKRFIDDCKEFSNILIKLLPAIDKKEMQRNRRLYCHFESSILFILSELFIDHSTSVYVFHYLSLYYLLDDDDKDDKSNDSNNDYSDFEPLLIGSIFTLMTSLVQESRLDFHFAQKFIDKIKFDREMTIQHCNHHSNATFVSLFCKALVEKGKDEHFNLWTLIANKCLQSFSKNINTDNADADAGNRHYHQMIIIPELLDPIIFGGSFLAHHLYSSSIPVIISNLLISYFHFQKEEIMLLSSPSPSSMELTNINTVNNNNNIVDKSIHALGAIFDQQIKFDSDLFRSILDILLSTSFNIDYPKSLLIRHSWTLANLAINYQLEKSDIMKLVDTFKKIMEKDSRCLSNVIRGISALLCTAPLVHSDNKNKKGNDDNNNSEKKNDYHESNNNNNNNRDADIDMDMISILLISYIKLAFNGQSSKAIWNASYAIRNLYNDVNIIPLDLLDMMLRVGECTDNIKIKISILETLSKCHYHTNDNHDDNDKDDSSINSRIRRIHTSIKRDTSFYATSYRNNIEKLDGQLKGIIQLDNSI